jgi:predicted transcriptional regulator
VLICLSLDPQMRLRDVADQVNITERAVQRIVSDLVEAGVLIRQRDGRRNYYEINADEHLRHPLESHRTVAQLLALGRDD